MQLRSGRELIVQECPFKSDDLNNITATIVTEDVTSSSDTEKQKTLTSQVDQAVSTSQVPEDVKIRKLQHLLDQNKLTTGYSFERITNTIDVFKTVYEDSNIYLKPTVKKLNFISTVIMKAKELKPLLHNKIQSKTITGELLARYFEAYYYMDITEHRYSEFMNSV